MVQQGAHPVAFPSTVDSESRVPTQPSPACISPDLPSKSSISHFVAVLCSHSNLGIQLLPYEVNVGGGGRTNHL